MIDSIHDFQRQGGLTKQFEHLDKVFSTYLVAPAEEQGDGLQHASEDQHASEHQQASENRFEYVESEEQ